MNAAIRDLLDALEAAEAAGATLDDTVLREALCDVIYRGFVQQEAGFLVPEDLLLYYTEEAEQQNAAVIQALSTFLELGRSRAAALGLDTPEKRKHAFRDSQAESSSGEVNVDTFFDSLE